MWRLGRVFSSARMWRGVVPRKHRPRSRYGFVRVDGKMQLTRDGKIWHGIKAA